jgi:hypothetical protein
VHFLELKRGNANSRSNKKLRVPRLVPIGPWRPMALRALLYDEAIATVTAWGVLRREVRPQ